MNKKLNLSLQELLEQWQRNQQTHILDGAEDAATLLEHRFYTFIEVFREWFYTIPRPKTLEQALCIQEIEEIVEQLPAPLYLPFENELDLLVDGVELDNDEKYD